MEEKTELKNFRTQKILFSILIIIFSIGLVTKTFQNDTFFNISIGKYILENGIDMKEHFSWVQGLDYTYSHWAYDIVISLIYKFFNFTGIYIGLLILTAIINVTMFNLISNRIKVPILSFFVTMFTIYFVSGCYAARSQIISFLCFIIEIYCIEQFIDTNKNKYAICIIFLSIIVANFHAATWPLTLILFLPYIAPAFLNFISPKNIYLMCAKHCENKYNKYKDIDPNKAEGYKKDSDDYMRFANEKNEKRYSKIIRKENYNIKRLLILFIIICFTGLITPIHDVPYTYILKSMLGDSQIPNHASIDYILEMQPTVIATSLPMIIFMISFTTLFAFMPTKIKSEHGFLILGLFIMSIMSKRYCYLLLLLGSFVMADLLKQAVCAQSEEVYEKIKNIHITRFVFIILLLIVSAFSIKNIKSNYSENYVDETSYPVGATEYILNNVDYKNMKIFNNYSNGSYLMLNNIKVFIDSRLDVYCCEFADTEVFKDYIAVTCGHSHYKDIFDKYAFTHILLEKDDFIDIYIKDDSNYKEIYSDDYYVLYKRVNN